MRCAAVYLLSAALLIGAGQGFADRATAQTVPPDQSCGGLLCDMGVFGHKVPPATPAPAPPAPAKTAAIAPSLSAAADEAVVAKAPVRKKRRIAKAVAAPAAPARTVAATTPVARKAPAPSASAPAAPAPDETPASDWVIGGAPAGQKPADMFQPIYR